MAKKKNTKCRTWTFVLYPEDNGTADLLAYLKTDNIEKIRGFYIMHQPKVKTNEETGEPVLKEDGTPEMTKAHYHVIVNFPNARSADGVVKALCLFKDEVEKNENDNTEETVSKPIHVESVHDISSMYYYCLHWTYACKRANKEEYKESDIIKLGNDSSDFVLSCKGERDLTSRVTCAELLQRAEKTSSCKGLLMECIDDEHLVKFMLKNPYFVKTFISGGSYPSKGE